MGGGGISALAGVGVGVGTPPLALTVEDEVAVLCHRTERSRRLKAGRLHSMARDMIIRYQGETSRGRGEERNARFIKCLSHGLPFKVERRSFLTEKGQPRGRVT